MATFHDVDPLDDAAAAYRQALTALQAARAAVPAARATLAQRRQALADAMVAAARDGATQTDIIRRSGYTRERVRQILRAGGIEPVE